MIMLNGPTGNCHIVHINCEPIAVQEFYQQVLQAQLFSLCGPSAGSRLPAQFAL